jgi:hypothetical protein
LVFFKKILLQKKNMTIPIATNENIFQYHQVETQLNICKGNFQLPIIRHERRPAADVDFIRQLNEDDGLKETRIQLMYNVVKGKHDPTLMYNVLLRAGPKLRKIINAIFALPAVIPSAPRRYIRIAYALPYEVSVYCDVINILLLSAAGLAGLKQIICFIQTTMLFVHQIKFPLFDIYSFTYQIPVLELPNIQNEIPMLELPNIQNEIPVLELPNIQNEIPAPELNSFLSQINWNVVIKHTLSTGVILLLASSGVACLIPVSTALSSIYS